MVNNCIDCNTQIYYKSKRCKECHYVYTRRGFKISEEHKRKISESNKGKIILNEVKQKISKTRKKMFENGYVNPTKGIKRPDLSNYNKTQEKRELLRNRFLGIPKSIEHRKNISKSRKIYCSTEKGKDQLRKNGINATIKQAGKISKAELILKNYLIQNKINFETQYKYNLGIADFYLPKKNLIVECNGSYWHSKKDKIEKDKIKYKWLEDNGYSILLFWSEDIVENRNDLDKFIGDISLLK